MTLPPRNPSDAYTRFRKSMMIDYDAWREGTPYDIAALSEISDEERDLLTEELCEKSSLDWRDVEALRALATPKALKRVGVAAQKQTDGGGIEAFFDEVAQGWTPEIEARFIEKLERVQSMTGALDRLYEIAQAHPTPAVMEQLMRNARIHSDPTVRYSMGGFLLELSGHVDTRYTFDANIRPHLLNLNSADYAEYKAAVAWLSEKVANPQRNPGA
ncbi:MAG: hypothetical protein IPG56_13225 [Caulobacteraceae bacterium]|nr:hypothetical protein [Caulobacteraceae bacterium]